MNKTRTIFWTEVPLWAAVIILVTTVSLAWMFFVGFYGQTVRGFDIGNLSDGSENPELIYGPQRSLSNVNFF